MDQYLGKLDSIKKDAVRWLLSNQGYEPCNEKNGEVKKGGLKRKN